MMRARCLASVLTCLVGLVLPVASHATTIVTVRATSINDVLRDLETLTTSAGTPFDREQVLSRLATTLGAADLSFLDLTRPVALAMPAEGVGLSAGTGFVVAVPVRDGAAALDAVARLFPERPERSVEGGLTVLRAGRGQAPEAQAPPPVYATVRARTLIFGRTAECVRAFDPVSVASAELPAGSLAVSLEVEPLRDELRAGLSAARETLKQAPPPAEPADEEAQPPEPEITGESLAPVMVTEGITPPQLMDKVTPRYPEEARLARTEGRVVLQAVIDTSGNVRDVSVLKSSDPVFDEAAIAAVRQWKYAPAVQGGSPVSVYFTVIVEFKLHGAAGPPPPQEAGEERRSTPFDPRQLGPMFDMYFDFLGDAIDSVSKLQISIEVSDGYLIVHGRGAERPESTLAGFIAVQRDTGLPAIGRMMPAHASMIVAGRLSWTESSRAWMKTFLQRYRTAMNSFLEQGPEADREERETFLRAMELWQSDPIIDCQRGDLAFAMDQNPGEMQMLQVWGISNAERCLGALGSVIASTKSAPGGGAFLTEETLEPEMVRTWVYRVRIPELIEQEAPVPGEALTIRFAEVGDMVISGTDAWATRAIREAAQARQGTVPGGGGLVLADLGPFTQRPGIFGRMQLGAVLRQGSAPADNLPQALIQALEGPAGAIPFAMRFDDGAATVEFAIPLAMLEAFAKHAPTPAPEPVEEPLDD